MNTGGQLVFCISLVKKLFSVLRLNMCFWNVTNSFFQESSNHWYKCYTFLQIAHACLWNNGTVSCFKMFGICRTFGIYMTFHCAIFADKKSYQGQVFDCGNFHIHNTSLYINYCLIVFLSPVVLMILDTLFIACCMVTDFLQLYK